MTLSLQSQRLEEERRERLDNVLWDRALQEMRHPTTPQARMHLARSLLGAEMLHRNECRFPRLALAVKLVDMTGVLRIVSDFNRLMEPDDPFVLFVLQLPGSPPGLWLTTRREQQALTFRCHLRLLDSS